MGVNTVFCWRSNGVQNFLNAVAHTGGSAEICPYGPYANYMGLRYDITMSYTFFDIIIQNLQGIDFERLLAPCASHFRFAVDKK